MDQIDALNAHDAPTGTSSVTTVNHSLVATSGEQCPSCGMAVAADQRYCLHCGQRCGEPRLPFMNAVTFMDAMKRPTKATAAPPPKDKRRRLSPNAALIAGVGTLLLAMGVGVLIGNSGNDSATSTPAAPQIIKVPAGGGAEATTAATAGGQAGAGGGAKSKGKQKTAASLKKEATTQKGAEEVLKPSAGVKLPPATVEPGSSCSGDTAGCKGGEFTGEFFGE